MTDRERKLMENVANLTEQFLRLEKVREIKCLDVIDSECYGKTGWEYVIEVISDLAEEFEKVPETDSYIDAIESFGRKRLISKFGFDYKASDVAELFGRMDLTDYIEENFTDAMELIKNGDHCIYDLDSMVALRNVLNMSVNYELFRYINATGEYDINGLFNITSDDKNRLMELVKEYYKSEVQL